MGVAKIHCYTTSTEPRWLITLLQTGAQLGRVNWKVTRDPNSNNLHVVLHLNQTHFAIDQAKSISILSN